MLMAVMLALAPPVRRLAATMPRDRVATWSNPLGTTLTQIADNVHIAERSFYPTLPGLTNTDVGCKMVVVRLESGALWVHSPVALDGAMRKELSALGEVKHVVTPNTEHQKWAPDYIREFPEASSWACPGLRERKPHVGWKRSLEELLDAPGGLTSNAPPAEWEGEIELCWLRDQVPLLNRPFFNEVVFFHRPSSMLIVTDLWWNYPLETDLPTDVPPPSMATKLWKAGMDIVYRPFYNRLMRTESWGESIDTILSWEFDYIVPCHGDPVAENGKDVLREHLNFQA
jgi:hypothetical protein